MIAKLHYISQAKAPGSSHVENVYEALNAGVKWVQLRVKDATDDFVKDQALEVQRLCKKYGAKFIINDYVQLAANIKADGVHIGKADMPISEAREILGAQAIVGATANTLQDCIMAAESGANYIGLGPFRFTGTKKNLSPVLGMGGYQAILKEFQRAGYTTPIIAIGGVIKEDIKSLCAMGLHGVAMAGAINADCDKEKVIEEIKIELA